MGRPLCAAPATSAERKGFSVRVPLEARPYLVALAFSGGVSVGEAVARAARAAVELDPTARCAMALTSHTVSRARASRREASRR